jgi:hypothetical protein
MGIRFSSGPEKRQPRGSPPDGFKRVRYLTVAQYAVSNITLRRIKVARFSDLNDPFELLSVARSDLKNRYALREKMREITDETGWLCFSNSWSDLVL